jgi:DeoR family transcriptional regulator of aga operon/DeoR family fructose operon transcriptional repressor
VNEAVARGIFAPGMGDAFSRERQERIARLVELDGRALVADLSAGFSVSRQTIRKDLSVLAAEGRLTRAHGGAIASRRGRSERTFDVRERLQRDQKAAIGTEAAARISDGESIALDASTTCLYLARAIRARGGWSQLTIVTNGLQIATELASDPGIAVVMPGGRVRWEATSLVGGISDGVFERINVQTAFVGAVGFTIETGLSEATEEESEIKRSMIAVAREVVAIVDHTKWGRTAFSTFCPTERLTAVISDASAPQQMVEQLCERGVEVRLVRQPYDTTAPVRSGRGSIVGQI